MTAASEPAIQLAGVDKRFRVYRERYRSLKEILIHRRLGVWQDRWALRDASLDVPRGTTFGLIGPNGAGKSTVLKLMARILVPDRGTVRVNGRLSALIELGAGFQLEYTGRENVYLNGSLLGLSKREIDRRFDSILDFSELHDHIDEPLRTFSSGMYMRLGFAVAIHVDPEVMLVDEILAVGDEAFQRKCFDWLEAFQQGGGTIVMISHNLGAVRDMCSQVAWLEDGRIRELGSSEEVVASYLDSVREERGRLAEIREIAGRDAKIPPIEVGDVRLLDRAGRPATTLRMGEDLTVELGYRVNQPIASPMFGVMVYRNDGTYIYGTNTASDGVALPALDQDGAIRLRLNNLRLLDGSYRLTVVVFADQREGTPPSDYHEQRYVFRVRSGTLEQGLVQLEHEWELAEPAEAKSDPPLRGLKPRSR